MTYKQIEASRELRLWIGQLKWKLKSRSKG